MVYTTTAKVRMIAGNPTTQEIPEATISQFIIWSDAIIDGLCKGSANKFQEHIRYPGNNIRFISLSKSLSSVNRVYINEEELKEYAEDKLDDGECETEDSTDTSPEYWTSTTASNVTYSWSTTSNHGYRSLEISNAASATGKYTADKVSVEDSVGYKATAWIKAASVTGNCYLRIRWLEEDGTTEITTNDSTAITGTQDWTEASVEAVSPPHVGYAQVQLIHAGSAGDVYGDDFTFRKRNWRADTTNTKIELTDLPTTGDILIVDYTLSSTDALVGLASTHYAAAFCINYSVGLKTSGHNYEDLKGASSRVIPMYARVIEDMIKMADNAIKKFLQFESTENNDLGIVQMSRVGYFKDDEFNG